MTQHSFVVSRGAYVYDMYMAQLNLNLDPEFERNIKVLMKARSEKHKSALLKSLVRDAVAALGLEPKSRDFSALIGLAKPGLSKKKKFLTEDDLWS